MAGSTQVIRLAVPESVVTGQALAVMNGVAFGQLAIPAATSFGFQYLPAYWPTPSNCIELPPINSQDYAESLTAESPNGNFLAGTTSQVNGDGFPFVYDVKKKSYQMLQLNGALPITFPYVNSVTDEGIVTGRFHPDRTVLTQNFTYNLATNTYTLSDGPNPEATFPNPAGGHGGYVTSYSPGGQFAIGTATFQASERAVVWNVSSGFGQVIGPARYSARGALVSDDGTVAIVNVDSPLSKDSGPWVWTKESGSRALYDLLVLQGFAKGIVSVSVSGLSADGAYICFVGNGAAEGTLIPTTPFFVRVK